MSEKYASETLSILENLKQNFKFGSVPLRVSFRLLFKNFGSVTVTCYCSRGEKYASNTFLIVSWRPNSFMTT